MTKTQEKRWRLLQASPAKIRGRKQCQVCQRWIHKMMETCQPCEGATPRYSKFHKF